MVLDGGQFSLRCGDHGDPDVSRVVHRALEGEHVAQDGPVPVMITPHRTNVAMALCATVFGGPPAGPDVRVRR